MDNREFGRPRTPAASRRRCPDVPHGKRCDRGRRTGRGAAPAERITATASIDAAWVVAPAVRFGVEQQFAPILKPGDIVVMDNLSSHKVRGVREANEAVSAELRYLPPCSPDLNPGELAFAKLKKLLRDGTARTVDKLWELCGRIL